MQQYTEVEEQAKCVRLVERSQEQHFVLSSAQLMIYTGDVWGFFCYCNGPLMDLPGGLNQETVRECCIDRNGYAYNLFIGDEDCTECIGERSYTGYNDMEFIGGIILCT